MLSLDRAAGDTERQEEAEAMCRWIGIDHRSELDRYRWLVDKCLDCKLANGWTRERDPNGKLYFFNRLTEEIRTQHPEIEKFRKVFAKYLE